MKVTIKGQVTIPPEVRDDMGIRPAESEVEFVRDRKGRWFLKKTENTNKSRFRVAHNKATPIMSTDELMALTRR